MHYEYLLQEKKSTVPEIPGTVYTSYRLTPTVTVEVIVSNFAVL